VRTLYSALHNTLRLATFSAPTATRNPVFEYIILNRPTADILTISDAGGAPAILPSEAPSELRENNTLVGTLISTDSTTEEETFIFNRYLPENTAIRGKFFPADGYAILSFVDDKPRLRSSGRHSHAKHLERGSVALVDAAGDGAQNTKSLTWHFDAVHLPWSEETT